MNDVISINDSINEVKEKLQLHAIGVPYYGWEIMVYLMLNSFPNKKAKIVGYGRMQHLRRCSNENKKPTILL